MTHPTTIRYVGLDVHKSSIVIAVADGERGPATILATISNDFVSLRQALHRLGTPERLSCCYEAGPTGYGLYRQLRAAGYRCTVIAPSLVPVQSGNRVKTDRRDAAKLAHFLRSGDLTTVHVPDEATEAIRDLERARDDAKRAEQIARHQLAKFLLRHGRRYEGKLNWNTAHLAWIGKQQYRPADAGRPARRPPGRRHLVRQLGDPGLGRGQGDEPVELCTLLDMRGQRRRRGGARPDAGHRRRVTAFYFGALPSPSNRCSGPGRAYRGVGGTSQGRADERYVGPIARSNLTRRSPT